ncbi:hypothetical protein ABE096_08480 [Robertmurraya massiliosenegalensis]
MNYAMAVGIDYVDGQYTLSGLKRKGQNQLYTGIIASQRSMAGK